MWRQPPFDFAQGRLSLFAEEASLLRRSRPKYLCSFGYTEAFPRSHHSAALRTRKDQPMASPAVDFARNNQQRFLNELKDLLRIPSVSTLEEHKPDVAKAAHFVADDLRRIGKTSRSFLRKVIR